MKLFQHRRLNVDLLEFGDSKLLRGGKSEVLGVRVKQSIIDDKHKAGHIHP